VTEILIVEDDHNLGELLAYNVRQEGYTPLVATTAGAAVELAKRNVPALILLDLMLPGGSGFDVCRVVREFSSVPIIMLTARGEDVDRILGLEMGADDYVTKPFVLRELVARIRANLRRVALEQTRHLSPVLVHGELSVDVSGRRVTLAGQSLMLQPKEFDLLAHLMTHLGTVMTRERLLQEVWGHQFVGARTVDVHVRRLRMKLGRQSEELIRTVHGVGYVFGARDNVRSTG
jgi:DNA-binding response OmpR family regulator